MAEINNSLGTNSGTNITKTSELINDGENNTSTYVEVSDLESVAFTGNYNDLFNLPTIPSGNTNLTYSPSSTNGIVNSDTGTDATIPLATNINAGLLSPNEKSLISTAIQTEDLSDVAFSGNYNDLNNLPNLNLKEDKFNKGIANGYGSLDINGKQPLSEVNDALIGNVHWKGIYNGTVIISSPDTGLIGNALPTPSSSNTGWYFIAQGSFTNSGNNYETGDWIISDGLTWNKVDNTDAVSSVNSKVGNVVLNTDDILETGTPTNKWWSNLRTITSNLTGYISGAGIITAADTILSAIQKLNGNINNLITGVSSVFGRTGVVTAQTGDYNTEQITEVTNKKFVTDAYLTVLSNTSNTNTGDETTATIKSKLGVASTSTEGYLTNTDWNTFNNKQNTIPYTTQEDLWTWQRTKGSYIFEDFLGTNDNSGISTTFGFTSGSSGTGAVNRTTGTFPNRTNQTGVVLLSTGTTSTGNATLRLGSANAPQHYIGSGAISYETYVNIETLSNSTDRFTSIIGLYTGGNVSSTANGIFFIYDEGGVWGGGVLGASPNWRCVTVNTYTRTTTNSGVAISASEWVKLGIEINAAGTSVGFYINGSLVATHTTNIPSTSTAMHWYNLFNKTAGTTSVNMYFDYIAYRQIFTNPR